MNRVIQNPKKPCSQSLLFNSGACSTPITRFSSDPDYTFSTISSTKTNPRHSLYQKREIQTPSTSNEIQSQRIVVSCNTAVTKMLSSPIGIHKITFNQKVNVIPSMSQLAMRPEQYPRVIKAKYTSSNNLNMCKDGHQEDNKRNNDHENNEQHRSDTDSSSNLENIESGAYLARVFEKYNNIIKDQTSKTDLGPEKAANILENFFVDLSSILPSYSEHLSNLQKLAHLIAKKQENNPSRQFNLKISKHKVISATSVKGIMESIPQIEIVDEICLQNNEIKKCSSSVLTPEKQKIPKLKLDSMTTGKKKDFNDEFMEKADLFSDSWREGCQTMKTIAYRNVNNDHK